GEPERTVGPGRDVRRSGDARDRVLRDGPGGGDAADAVGVLLGEPQRTVGTGGDPQGVRARRWDVVLRDRAGGRDAADLVGRLLGEPHRTVGADGDVQRATRLARRVELVGYDPGGRDPADRVQRAGLREPQRTVG